MKPNNSFWSLIPSILYFIFVAPFRKLFSSAKENLTGEDPEPYQAPKAKRPILSILTVKENGDEEWEEIGLSTEVKIDTDGTVYFKDKGKWIAQDDIVGLKL